MGLVSDFPAWMIVLCFSGALVYAVTLYFKDRTNRHFSKGLMLLLGIIRFSTILTLGFFILKPLIKTSERSEEKPIIIIGQDNSSSLVVGKDSTYYKQEYPQKLDTLIQALNEKYDLYTYTFGTQTKEYSGVLPFDENRTNISEFQDLVFANFTNRNVGAIILASDGIYNNGKHPGRNYRKLNVPIYTIALGDTTQKRDAIIQNVRVNRLSYLGNLFPVEIEIKATKLLGKSGKIEIFRNGNLLFKEDFTINTNAETQTFTAILEASVTGLQRYNVKISEFTNEITYANNSQSFFVDVIDNRQKILVLASSPHPDVKAFTASLGNNENYEVTSSLLKEFTGTVEDYSLIILHQVPNNSASSGIVKEIINAEIPVLFALGGQSDIAAFNNLNTGFRIENHKNGLTEKNSYVAKGFSLFNVDDRTANFVRKAPPLKLPFGIYKSSESAHSFIDQSVGNIETKDPIIGFNKSGEVKIGVILGEGLWRWRLFDFLDNSNHDATNEIIEKSVQYLASKDDKSLFRLSNKASFIEQEEIVFIGEVYNESYESVDDAEVTLRVTNSEGNAFDFAFSNNTNQYIMNAGSLPVGQYNFIAEAKHGGNTYVKKGEFSVSPVRMELSNTTADHNLLYQLSQDNGGELLYPDRMNTLPSIIESRDEIRTISHETNTLSDLINIKWILGLIILLLGTEWLLRKRNGSY